MKRQPFISILFILCFTLLVYSHGLSLKVEKQSPVVLVTSLYHGGSVLEDADVTIFFNDPQNEFQQGRADKRGKFSFVPDRAGDWFFRVDDGMGHRKTVKITVTADFFTREPVDSAAANKTGFQDENRVEPSGKEQARIDTGEAGTPENKKENPGEIGGMCIYCKVLLGVVLILVFSILLHTWKRKKEKQVTNK